MMSVLWFFLAFLALAGAGALLYVDKHRHTRHDHVRESWARDRGLNFEADAPDLERVWRRGVFPTARRVVDVAGGTFQGQQLYVFDVEEASTVIALQRPLGSPVGFDLRSDALPPPREPYLRLFGAIGTRIAYSTDLEVARRVCDRRMVAYADTVPDCVHVLWTEDDWALASLPINSTSDDWDDGIAALVHFSDLLRVLPPSAPPRRAHAAVHDPGHPHVP